MRRLFALAALALVLAAPARAASAPRPDARAWYVVNATTGEVLAQHDAYERVPIASITKLMTVIVALQHLEPGDVVSVTRRAAAVGEESIPLRPGQRITVHDLLAGALIQSANDAADALGDAAAGGDQSRFVGWMNAEAEKLGLHDSHFVRPDGLDAPGHLSSAHDVYVLARAAMRIPIVRQLVGRRSATIEGGALQLSTWDDLLGVFPGLIGVKTGHTDDAGWCQVAAAKRPGYTIYAVILGSPSRIQRNTDLRDLLAWGVSRYRRTTLVSAQPYGSAALGYGKAAVPLVAEQPLVRVVHVGAPVERRVVAAASAGLPVTRGQRLGRVEIWQNGKLLGMRPLVAARSVSRPGIVGRIRWYATRTVHDLWGLLP
ncbi:MAG TPA: D-alanyl-D-alanine carboxypeptidase family protein [Gaiellaceae bacterium]|nr:D-alanyl-D-alanine carboxypeptidase family protein [Gaiellaceae bacterium]